MTNLNNEGVVFFIYLLYLSCALNWRECIMVSYFDKMIFKQFTLVSQPNLISGAGG